MRRADRAAPWPLPLERRGEAQRQVPFGVAAESAVDERSVDDFGSARGIEPSSSERGGELASGLVHVEILHDSPPPTQRLRGCP